MRSDLDIIFVGGGLANCLLAWRLKEKKPSLRFMILEARDRWPEDRTWSFHGTDIRPRQLHWLRPLISKTWQGYDVRFPDHCRSLLGTTYNSIRGKDFFARINLDENVQFASPVKAVSEHGVTLKNGSFLGAKLVFDGRGLGPNAKFSTAYQKFVGLNLRLRYPHKLQRPMLMDASCDQLDGFRFLYALPWNERELLVEDTRYSSNVSINNDEYREEILFWIQQQGWQVEEILGREAAALPIPIAQPQLGSTLAAPSLGLGGGYFHYMTGYSLPHAVELADRFTQLSSYDTRNARRVLRDFERERARHCRWGLLLNRLAFGAAEPADRRRIYQRFYRFAEPMIQRFYAEELSTLDWLRMVVGKPPVSLRRAVTALRAGSEVTLC